MLPPRIVNLGKDELINYRYTIESWRSEDDVVKSSIERVGDLIEGVWNTCSNVLNEWGIGEIEESLESLTSKTKVVEQARAASASKIQDLVVIDFEAMHFSVISPTKMTTGVDENDRIANKGIKEIASLNFRSCLHARLPKGPEVEELMEINEKWETSEKSMGKASSL